jgi:hypothetical protein
LRPPWSRPWSLVDSNLAIVIVSTFIAAFAGTWAAQLLAERTATRKELRYGGDRRTR